jgi:hypothetical protein
MSAVSLFGAAWLAACGSGANPRPSESSIDAAYAALIGEVASCAKEVKVCVEAAGSDLASRAACREQFSGCRATAGEKATHELANAVTACTSQHNTCVRQAHGAAAADCKDELKVCLGAAHPKPAEDEDGGVDERGNPKGDCLDQLHSCVAADGPANACAEQVRSCVVDAVPTGDEVVPQDDDADETDENADDDADSTDESPDAGAPEQAGQSDNGRSNADKAQDAGTKKAARKTAAAQCLDTFSACVEAGSAQRTCAQSLKECRSAAK